MSSSTILHYLIACEMVVKMQMIDREDLDQILEKVKCPLDDPQFYPRVHSFLAKWKKKHLTEEDRKLELILSNSYEDVSRYLAQTGVQEPCTVRHRIRTNRIAQLLLDKDGNLLEKRLNQALNVLEQNLYFLGPERLHDAVRQEHIFYFLQQLKHKPEIQRLFKRVSVPMRNRRAQDLIRYVIRLDKKSSVKKVHARQAVLSACLSYVRQNVGSCFATAPAIMILLSQPENLMKDLEQLFSLGRLKRTFGGVEYSVPMSASWGIGDLNRPFVVFREECNIWVAPGVLAAMEATEVVDKAMSFEDKIAVIKPLVERAFEAVYAGQQAFVTTIDTLLKQVLLIHNGISEYEYDAYINKPRAMVQSTLMVDMTKSKKRKSAQPCQVFEEQFALAKEVFKSLSENALIKSWEFSLASFAETKAQLGSWNFYSSLGLNAQEPYGIGSCLYNIITRKLEQYNRVTQELHISYEHKFAEVKQAEYQLNNTTSNQDYQWNKMEYHNRVGEMNSILEERKYAHHRAERFAALYQYVIDYYESKFSEYFQEVYDADMHDVTNNLYDDSPAGFRLLYKFGRSDSSTWQMIYSAEDFIDCLIKFFNATEREMLNEEGMEGLGDDLTECVSEVVDLIRTDEFLEASLYRMAAAHQAPIPNQPLLNMDQVDKKPWVYVSGGTMDTLVSCYYCREQKPKGETVNVESEVHLVSFLIETMKRLPDKNAKAIEKDRSKMLLMHSPTHAFLLTPGKKCYYEAWHDAQSSSAWVNSQLVMPGKNFIQQILLDEQEMRQITSALAEKVPPPFRERFLDVFKHFPRKMTPKIFREFVINKMMRDPFLQVRGELVLAAEEIDSVLFRLLPFSPTESLDTCINMIFQHLGSQAPDVMPVYEVVKHSLSRGGCLSAEALRNICLSLIMLATGKITAKEDYYSLITEAMRECQLALPAPFIFADSNWVKDYFAFLINPGTCSLELWRVDYAGTTGSPMSMWREWVDGSYKGQRHWAIYPFSEEYGA